MGKTLNQGQIAIINGNNKNPENNGKLVKLIEFEGKVNCSNNKINTYCQDFNDIWIVESISTLNAMGKTIHKGERCRMRALFLKSINTSNIDSDDETNGINTSLPKYIQNAMKNNDIT